MHNPVWQGQAATARELLEGVREPEDVGVFAGRPLVAVQVPTADDPALTTLVRRLTGTPCVTVGVATATPPAALDAAGGPTVATGLDILLAGTPDPPWPWVGCPDVGVAVRELSARASATPTAAVALVQLLRLSERLDPEDGLVAESFVYGLLQAGAEHRRWLAGRSVRPRSPAGPAVLVERHDGELLVELHRPAVRNAFSAQMRDELVAAFQLAAADPTVDRVRVTGAGPSFCSGGDLDEFGRATDPSEAHLVRTTRSAARSMLPCAGRTVVAVHGACVGAGAELAALAGRVEAHPDAFFLLPEVAMGLVPGAGGTVSLPRRIGRHRTAYLALSGHPVDAVTAQRWGLVDAVAGER